MWQILHPDFDHKKSFHSNLQAFSMRVKEGYKKNRYLKLMNQLDKRANIRSTDRTFGLVILKVPKIKNKNHNSRPLVAFKITGKKTYKYMKMKYHCFPFTSLYPYFC
jgi:hypothetical protein